jgi:hypothetical protein
MPVQPVSTRRLGSCSQPELGAGALPSFFRYFVLFLVLPANQLTTVGTSNPRPAAAYCSTPSAIGHTMAIG